MRKDIEPRSFEPHSPWWKKLAWMLAIWVASVTALGIVAWVLRLLMQGAGLTR